MNRRPAYRLRLNVRLLPWLVLLLLGLQLLTPYRGWLILLVGLGGAWLLALLWAHALGRGLTVTRETRLGWAKVGDRMVERLTLTNASRAPAVWVEIIDHSDLPDAPANRVAGVGAGDQILRRVARTCTRRGLYRLGPTSLRSGDPLGIYTVELSNPSAQSILVTPPIVPLPPLAISLGGHAGDTRPRRHALARRISDAGVRPYLPGDSLRRVHWPTSARHDDLYVRRLEGIAADDWWLFLDLDRTVQAGEGEDSTIELGVVLAASLADLGLRRQQRVGLAMYGPGLVWLPPREDSLQRWRILRALALAGSGRRPLEEVLALAQPGLGRAASLVVITASQDLAWVAALDRLRRRGAAVSVMLLDTADFGVPRRPSLEASLARRSVAATRIGRELLVRSLPVDAFGRPAPRQETPRWAS